MPIGPLYDKTLNERIDEKAKLAVGKTKIGFFGFSYFHKKLDVLIEAWKDPALKDDSLVFFSSAPKQDIYNYEAQCLSMLNGMGKVNFKDYFYFNKYHSEEEILQYLSMCDIITLPYAHYGSHGSSAAASLALRAGVPILVSDTSWFSHIPSYKVLNLEILKKDKSMPVAYLGDTPKDIVNFRNFVVRNPSFYNNKWQDNLKKFADDSSTEKFALAHMKLAYGIV